MVVPGAADAADVAVAGPPAVVADPAVALDELPELLPQAAATSPCAVRSIHGWAARHRPRGRRPVDLEARGGGAGNRTPGLNSAIVALYQLSYTPAGGVRLADDQTA